MESIEILKEKIKEEIEDWEKIDKEGKFKSVLSVKNLINNLCWVKDVLIPFSIAEAKDAEATELLSKCKFSKDIKDAPVHGNKYLIHDKTEAVNAEKEDIEDAKRKLDSLSWKEYNNKSLGD